MVKVKCARLYSVCHDSLLNIEKLENLEVLFLQSTSNDSLSKMNTIHFPVFLKTLIVRCEAEYFKISKKASKPWLQTNRKLAEPLIQTVSKLAEPWIQTKRKPSEPLDTNSF